MKHIKQIVIVGQPGAGKGLLARSIAEALNWQFVDADLQIERRLGRCLVDVIGSSGLKYFYSTQEEVLQQLQCQENVVVATDSAVVAGEACRKLLASMFVVFVDVSLPIQLERLSVNQGPLLADLGLADLLEQLHQQRDGFNEDVADYRLCSNDNELEEHVKTVVELVGAEHHPVANQLRISDEECLFMNRCSHERVRLSKRQAQCLKLLAKGMSDKQIADALCVSTRTVEDHVANIKKMLSCQTSKQLIALYHG